MLTTARPRYLALGVVVVLALSGCRGATRAAESPSPGLVVPSPRAGDPQSEATSTALRFLAAWSAQRYSELPSLVDDQTSDVAGIYKRFADRLGIDAITVTPGELDASGTAGTAMPYHAVLTLHGLGSLPIDNRLELVPAAGGYRVAFRSSTVFPGLKAGERVVRQTAPLRGPLLDRAGAALRGVDRDLDINVLGEVSAGGHGSGGLERALDSRLAGPSHTVIQVVNATTGEVLRTVAQFGDAKPPPGVTTTLDPGVQRAARAALAGVPGVAAIVALDASTGAVRAAANTPITGFPPALRGSYAPGSTFKTVTALAALTHGFTTSSRIDCPATVTAGGKVFRNHEPGSRGQISLLTAYAESCNTAFVNLSQSLPKGSVTAAARMLGFNAPPPLPVPSAGGSLPPPADTAEAAADAIGQGRVEASPLLMASVAAAVADGTWRQPHLLDCADCTTTALPPAAVQSLRQMMRAVVTQGTGSALAAVPGGPVAAKTGTAEYGAANPPATHAWMIGYQGQLAFAVYVETGVSGGRTAGPIAASFLRRLAGT